MHARLAIAALLLGTIAGTGTEAVAQCAFDQSSPNANDVLRDPQPVVTIDFAMEFDLQQVRLMGADSTEWPTDWAPAGQEVRKAEFRATRPLPPGKYLIEWNGYLRRHFHADGGSIPFTVAAAGDGGPEPSPAAGQPSGGAPRSGRDSLYRAFLGAAAPQPGR